MYTRCPDCHAIYPLRASWLAQDQGKAECGRCGKIYNTLNQLFDDWPEPDEMPALPAEQNTPFHLSHRFTNQRQQPAPASGYHGATPQDDEDTGEDESSGQNENWQPDPNQLDLLPAKNHQWLWITLLLLVIPLTLANFGWHYRQQLLENPTIRTTAEGLGLVEIRQTKSRKNPELFQLLSRDMHAHPSQPGALVLSLTMVNRADYRQELPVIELRLLNTSQRVLASRQLTPDEYLADRSSTGNGLAPDALLPLVIEFADPGIEAQGFEIRFL
ncbi:MAG: DUF3426 domain-containing protein [Proteobacteria bacterium]|nr:DUF3426 domain-containing protein [Pseudomonadota bacterium]